MPASLKWSAERSPDAAVQTGQRYLTNLLRCCIIVGGVTLDTPHRTTGFIESSGRTKRHDDREKCGAFREKGKQCDHQESAHVSHNIRQFFRVTAQTCHIKVPFLSGI
jgi:hypothetical protein